MVGNDSFRTNMRNRVKSNSRNFDESLACMTIFIDTSLIRVKLFFVEKKYFKLFFGIKFAHVLENRCSEKFRNIHQKILVLECLLKKLQGREREIETERQRDLATGNLCDSLQFDTICTI